MLGDDIMDGTRKAVAIVAHAAKNVLKGALLFAAVVGGAYAIGLIGASIYAGGLTGLYAGLAEGVAQLANFVIPTTISDTVGYAGTAGLIGGAVSGVASLIPGKDEGFSLRSTFKKIEGMGRKPSRDQAMEPEAYPQQQVYNVPAPVYQPAPQPIVVHQAAQPVQPQPVVIVQQPQTQPAPQVTPQFETQTQEGAATANDHPYFRPGRGTELMQRGNAAESTIAK